MPSSSFRRLPWLLVGDVNSSYTELDDDVVDVTSLSALDVVFGVQMLRHTYSAVHSSKKSTRALDVLETKAKYYYSYPG